MRFELVRSLGFLMNRRVQKRWACRGTPSRSSCLRWCSSTVRAPAVCCASLITRSAAHRSGLVCSMLVPQAGQDQSLHWRCDRRWRSEYAAFCWHGCAWVCTRARAPRFRCAGWQISSIAFSCDGILYGVTGTHALSFAATLSCPRITYHHALTVHNGSPLNAFRLIVL